ncbi:hypothetical protein EVAR_88519_1 [Eumeta japonica]|uniref:Reverse transcriptase domain-containing protein n=1 Tax=Eumeta variegata TaxID=151549 RepID=A0A4C1WK42_EUMVA|nr:hypothetical protein EVAR_88519_1 [Eumeta japonica]
MDALSVKCVVYANNQVIFAPSASGLQEVVTNMNDSVKKSHIKVNLTKTKVMVFERGENTTECDKEKIRFRIVGISIELRSSRRRADKRRRLTIRAIIRGFQNKRAGGESAECFSPWKLILAIVGNAAGAFCLRSETDVEVGSSHFILKMFEAPPARLSDPEPAPPADGVLLLISRGDNAAQTNELTRASLAERDIERNGTMTSTFRACSPGKAPKRINRRQGRDKQSAEVEAEDGDQRQNIYRDERGERKRLRARRAEKGANGKN